MDSECIFCRISAGDIPATMVRDTPTVIAFRDNNPQAPTHILIAPRRHVASLAELNDFDLAGELLMAAADLARQEGVAETGFRVVTNAGAAAGQTVFHLHLHLLGGRPLAVGLA